MTAIREFTGAGFAGLTAAALAVFAVLAVVEDAVAHGTGSKPERYASGGGWYDRARTARPHRQPRRRYDPMHTSGVVPSDIDLNAPGGPELLFEIIRRNSR